MAFSGGIATQDIRWGFECEFCGKDVEVKTTMKEKYGVDHKASSTVVTGAGGKMFHAAVAEGLMNSRKERIDEDVQSGTFKAPEEADGMCPYCHRYQSWSEKVKDWKSFPELIGAIIVNIIASVIVGGIVGFVLALLISTFWKSAPKAILDPFNIAAVFICILALWLVISEIVSFIRVRISMKKLRTIENRNKPYFIAWEGEARAHSTGNMKERV